MRALSAMRGALVLFAALASNAGALQPSAIWQTLYDKAASITPNDISTTLDRTQPRLELNGNYIEFPVNGTSSVNGKINARTVYNTLVKADQINRTERGEPMPYSPLIKWYLEPVAGAPCTTSCTNVLGYSGSVRVYAYENSSGGKTVKNEWVSGSTYGAAYIFSDYFYGSPCVGGEATSPVPQYGTYGVDYGTSPQDVINQVEDKNKAFWAAWKVRPALCDSFAKFIEKSGDSVLSDYRSAILVLKSHFINPVGSYIILDDAASLLPACRPEDEICEDVPVSGDGGTGETPPATGGTTTPACTRTDGTTSGNPYDCAPSDNETKCGIIDIPCNLKKLFIPNKDFLSNKLKDGFGLNVKFPLTVVDEWSTNITFAGQTFKIGANFGLLKWSEQAKDQFRFLAWWGTFLFLLAFLGVPFMSRKAMGDAAQDHTAGRAAREAANNERIDREYEKWRNTPY